MKIRQLLYTAWIGIALSVQVEAQEPLWIDLQNPEILSEPIPNAGFYIRRVVDARPGYTRSGWIQRAATPVAIQLSFQGGLENQLERFFASRLPRQHEEVPVVVKVHRLWVSEYTTTYEMGTAAVALDFLLERNDTCCLLFRSCAFVKDEGIDVARLHEPNLIKALNDCLLQFVASDWKTRLTQDSCCTTPQLFTSASGHTQAVEPASQMPLPVQGVYQTFVDFREKKPDQKTPLFIKQQAHFGTHRNKIMLYYALPDREREAVEDVWGFSDGKQTYIYFQEAYFPLHSVEGGFVFEAYPMPAAYLGEALPVDGVQSGMLDGGFMGVFDALLHSNRRQPYFLDAYTGQITTWHPEVAKYDGKAAAPAPDTTQGVLLTMYYKTVKRNPPVPIHVVFSGATHAATYVLHPNAYIQVPWKDRNTEVTVCIQEAQAPCYTFVPSASVEYLEYQPVSHSEAISIRPVRQREALFYLTPMGYKDIQVFGNKGSKKGE